MWNEIGVVQTTVSPRAIVIRRREDEVLDFYGVRAWRSARARGDRTKEAERCDRRDGGAAEAPVFVMPD